MKRHETPSKGAIASTASRTKGHAAQFTAAKDSRQRRLPGIYIRNGRFYGQIWMKVEKTARKFPLLTPDGKAVENLGEAKEAMEVLRNSRREDTLPTIGAKPSFAAYVETYFAKSETAEKKPGTLENERQALARWKAHLGDVRIDRITVPMIASFRDKRKAVVSARTVNLDQIALRNVLKRAEDDGHLRATVGLALKVKLKKMKEAESPKRSLVTDAEFQRVLAAVPGACAKNAVQFADYLRFLAYTGAREQEALKVRWQDVAARKVTIGAGGVAKNGEQRDVDFNPQLAALLREMQGRRAPDCTWLFPSPQRGPRDEHAKTFRESLLLARKAAGLEWFGFHDLRHRFASVAVMAGLDFMTIAGWLGHKDGGILVGKIYGHLSDKHKAKAAAKLRL